MEAKELLSRLSETRGVSGYESDSVTDLVEEAFRALGAEVRRDALGNLIAKVAGEGGNPPKVMLAAHMDEIGLMVSKIEDAGFLRVVPVGGVDPRTLVAMEVLVHGRESLPGVVGSKPPHLQSPEEQKQGHKMEDLFVDLGLGASEVKEKVRVGDLITLRRSVVDLIGSQLAGKSMDDRAGVVMLWETLRELGRLKYTAEVYLVATVQEEVGVRGATTSTFGIVPDIGIAVDVTHGDMPGVGENTYPLGKGPAVALGPHVHPKILARLRQVADDRKIPYQLEPSAHGQGTDAWAIQVSRAGVASGLVSIPLRYMHTSVELLSLEDLKAGARLLAEFIAGVDRGFVEELRCF